MCQMACCVLPFPPYFFRFVSCAKVGHFLPDPFVLPFSSSSSLSALDGAAERSSLPLPPFLSRVPSPLSRRWEDRGAWQHRILSLKKAREKIKAKNSASNETEPAIKRQPKLFCGAHFFSARAIREKPESFFGWVFSGYSRHKEKGGRRSGFDDVGFGQTLPLLLILSSFSVLFQLFLRHTRRCRPCISHILKKE